MNDKIFQELLITEKIGYYILSVFSVLYAIIAMVMLYTNNLFPAFISFVCSLIYAICYFKVSIPNISRIAIAVHLVAFIYAAGMVYYFGWDYGAQFYLLPSILFCYMGNLSNKKISYGIGISGVLIFVFLYLFMHAYKHSLNNNLMFNNLKFDNFAYVFHSFCVCIVIVVMMYTTKLKIYEDIEKREYVNEILSVNAFTDPLTHLLNRWAFMEKIQLTKPKKPFHFAIIDIDFFKKVNDTYGHSVGDEVLRVTASYIRVSFKKYTDLIARWGGEEFLVFAIGCSNEEFYKACNNFRLELNNSKFCGEELKVSASIGCLHIENNFLYSNFDKYIKEVDELLYKAKNSGRNNIKTNV